MSGGHNISLRTWLRKMPQPVAVLADDKRIEVPRSGRPWHELESTILSLAPTKVVLVDAAGSTLRAKSLSDLARPEDSDEKEIEGKSDLQVLASLLADAYDKGSKNPLLVQSLEFIERQAVRIAAQDREIEKLRAINAKLQAELLKPGVSADEGEGGLLQALVAGALQAQAGGAAITIPNGAKPRGKRKPEGEAT